MSKKIFIAVTLFLMLTVGVIVYAQAVGVKECCAVKRRYKCEDFPGCCKYPDGTAKPSPGDPPNGVWDTTYGICQPRPQNPNKGAPVWIGNPGGICPSAGPDYDYDSDGNNAEGTGGGNNDPGDGTEVIPELHQVKEWGTICMMETIFNVTDWIFYILLSIVVLLGIVAGVLFMTAAGDPGKVGTARNIIVFTIIGLVIAILAKVIPSIVLTVIS